MKRINIILYLSLAISLTSCEEIDPLETEQYKKEVYIVGANQSNNGGLSIVKLPFLQSDAEEVQTNISVAIGGSQEIDRDVKVTVAEAGTEALDTYNFKYLYNPTDIKYQYLPSSVYRIPEPSVTIKAGQTYATVPVFIKTSALNSDSRYALTFKVSSVSDPDYTPIRQRDQVLMFAVALHNTYSGIYQLEGTITKQGTVQEVSPVITQRNFQAINYNTIRLIHGVNDQSFTNAQPYGISVRINSDNTLTLTKWGNFNLLSGEGTYRPSDQTFLISYTYKEGTVTYKFDGKYMKNAE